MGRCGAVRIYGDIAPHPPSIDSVHAQEEVVVVVVVVKEFTTVDFVSDWCELDRLCSCSGN